MSSFSISILGDSISTYKGYNPPGYNIYYDFYAQAVNGLKSVHDTWWGRLMAEYQWHLCMNDSYSGSRVTGDCFPAASCEERLNNLHKEEKYPDFILVYIGFNDFGYGVPVVSDASVQDEEKELAYFESAYSHMVKRLKEIYKNSRIICATLMRTRFHRNSSWQFPEKYGDLAFEEYNQAIRKACDEHDITLADLAALDLRFDTRDGTHPTVFGHKTIADAWIACVSDILQQRSV